MRKSTNFSYQSLLGGLCACWAFLGLIATTADAGSEKEQITVQTLSQAMPRLVSSPWIKINGRRIEPLSYEYCDLKIQVKPDGTVGKLEMNYPKADSLKFGPYREKLLQAKFRFSEGVTQKSKYDLIARLMIQRFDDRGAQLLVPLDSSGAVLDYQAFVRTLKTNGYESSRLISFPSYYFSSSQIRSVATSVEPISIIHVQLDKDGNVLERGIVYQNDSALADMALIASGYAQYSPAKFKGKFVRSDGYLVVRYFSEISYPTTEWRPDTASAPKSIESKRVSWFCTADSITVPAEIRMQEPRTLTLAEKFGRMRNVSLFVTLDLKGDATVVSSLGINGSDLSKELSKRVSGMRFYPGFTFTQTSAQDSLAFWRNYSRGFFGLTAQSDSSSVYNITASFPISVAPRRGAESK